MIADRIDFISSYCDRWCERCAFTSRCSAYACQMAIAMCDGDVAAGIELAVGQPHPVGDEKEMPVGQRLMEEFEQSPPSRAELDRWDRDEKARRKRITKSALAQIAETYTDITLAWTRDHAERIRPAAETNVGDALEIIQWDVCLIAAKLRRALEGRDRQRSGGEDWNDDPIQNDWNGSAKVALISLARSEDAWRTVADVPDNCGAAVCLEAAQRLRGAAAQEFPDAWRFKRPGFDDPAPNVDDGRIR
jgi:hypothetical protein